MRELRTRLRAGRGESGFTLVETLVTMIVFSIAIAIVFQAVIAVQRMSREVQATSDAVSELRLGLATIDRQVRSGNVLLSPADEPAELASCQADISDPARPRGSCMRIFTQVNGDERCVQWQVIADPAAPGTGILRKRSWAPDWQTGGAVSGWSTNARGLLLSAQLPFTLQGASTAYKSRLLDVRLEAVDPRRSGETVVVQSSLSGRNTNYGYDSGLCSPAPPA